MTVVKTSVGISGDLNREAVRVGGYLIPCTRAVLDLSVGAIPTLTINLPVVHGVDVDLPQVEVALTVESWDALIALGWTPPDQGPRAHEYPITGQLLPGERT